MKTPPITPSGFNFSRWGPAKMTNAAPKIYDHSAEKDGVNISSRSSSEHMKVRETPGLTETPRVIEIEPQVV